MDPSNSADIRKQMLQVEQAYRQHWKPSSTLQIGQLASVFPDPQRDELLVRLIQIDMELGITQSRRPTRHGPFPNLKGHDIPNNEDEDEEEDRVTPRIELYALRFPQLRKRWEWLSQLVVFEYTLLSRGNHGQPISHYCDSFPEYATSIDELLRRIEKNLQKHASTIVSFKGRSKPDNTTIVASTEDAGTTWILPRTLGRYYLLSFVEAGGMGNVFRALDMRRGTLVAIKVMRRDDAWSVQQFNQEFRTLAQIRHPHLVRMYDAFSEDNLRYFSMELITGCDLSRWAAENRHSRNYFERLRLFVRQLISVIHHLHQQGIVHRDIKPSNILLRSPRSVVLLDCSLAQRWPLTTSSPTNTEGDEVVGTLCYMAPEVLNRQPAIPASDWYSLGVCLFEILTGDYPVPKDGDRSQQAHDIEQRLLELAPQTPHDLRQLCQSLLRYDASDRPTGTTIAQVMGAPALEPTLSTQPLIGRGSLIATIHANLHSPSTTQRFTMVYGEPGIGLSALLAHISGYLSLSDSKLLLRCKSYREDKTPLSIVSQLLIQFVDHLRLVDQSTWYPIFRKYTPTIGKFFPEVLIDETIKQDVKNEVSRADALSAITRLLEEISCQREIYWIIDDLQWCDTDSLRFLTEELLPSPKFRGRILGAFACSTAQITEGQPSHTKPEELIYLESLAGTQAYFAPPLRCDDMRRLFAELTISAQTRNATQLKHIFDAANGNPARLQHIARYIASEFENTTDSPLSSHRNPDRQLSTARNVLSKTARKITQFLACSTEGLKLITLERLLKAHPDEIQFAQEELEKTRWIVSTESSEGITLHLAASALRPIVLDTCSPAILKRRHQRLARCLITLNDSPWMHIGYHYEASGGFHKALSAYGEALRQAKTESDAQAAHVTIERLKSKLRMTEKKGSPPPDEP